MQDAAGGAGLLQQILMPQRKGVGIQDNGSGGQLLSRLLKSLRLCRKIREGFLCLPDQIFQIAFKAAAPVFHKHGLPSGPCNFVKAKALKKGGFAVLCV